MKIFLTGLIALIIGFVVGMAVMLFFYPYWFPPAQVNERVVNAAQKVVVANGALIHPNPRDPVHWGKGSVALYKDGPRYELFLQPNFEVGPGPAFHVYLSSAKDITKKNRFTAAKNVDLGKLKSFKGSQVYAVPGSVDVSQYQSVVIWCQKFKVLISSATLQPVKP